ncbi:MAG TPA: choice-of-anchor D domain-containing protein [Polyangiaceae bacterium]|nr:choice-of-anchor D domain-containing protein [Polyangiaceae bacterium]
MTEAGDDQRTGLYSNQPRLSPAIVSGGTFNQMFDAKVNGQVYAQPLVSQGTLLVVTETNDVYGLDPELGSERWHKNFGAPFDPAPLPCGDLTPSIGITGTPVIDSANTAYFFVKTTQDGVTSTVLHAIDVAKGGEKSGFPVTIAGAASNAPNLRFDAVHHLQRPGLLLMAGKVYGAFGAHCDRGPYQGWIVGVTTDGRNQTRWVTNTSRDGGGIWQSGGGIMSDGAGRMFVATGNGGALDGPIPGSRASMMSNFGEAIVRVDVQSDGSLQAKDFFAPYDAIELDDADLDFASGAPVALPDSFGTTAHPHLLVAVGKEGHVYLLDRDNLGGIGVPPSPGEPGADPSVFRSPARGGVWSKPAVWPGDGGYVYVPTASPNSTDNAGTKGYLYAYRRGLSVDGKPTLDLAATSKEEFGFSSSRPIVTSNGLSPGTAVVWIVHAPNGDGAGAQLQAFRATPNASGDFELLFQASVGQSSKFNPPGVGNGRIYVGTRDGHVLGFGSPVTPILTADATDFENVVVGSSRTVEVRVTADKALTIQKVTSSSAEFEVPQIAPATLAAGASTIVPVTFRPSSIGPKGASLVFTSDLGTVSTPLSGKGISATGKLEVSRLAVSFGGALVGHELTEPIVLRNVGATTLTLQAFIAPMAPFSALQLPDAGSQLEPDQTMTLTLRFAPTAAGKYTDSFDIQTSGGQAKVLLTGTCASSSGHLSITPLDVDFGRVPVGETRSAQFEVKNSGGLPLQITKSKPPVQGQFSAASELAEGTGLEVGDALMESVSFAPSAEGDYEDVWVLNSTGDNGVLQVKFHGTGVAAP